MTICAVLLAALLAVYTLMLAIFLLAAASDILD